MFNDIIQTWTSKSRSFAGRQVGTATFGITSPKGPEPGSRTQSLFGFVFQKAQQEIFGLTRWAQHRIHALP